MRWIEAVGMSLALLATSRLHGPVLTYLAVAKGVGRGRHGWRGSEGELRGCPNACACRYRSVCPGSNGNRRQVLSLDFYSPSLPTVQPTLNFQVLTDEHGLLQPSARESRSRCAFHAKAVISRNRSKQRREDPGLSLHHHNIPPNPPSPSSTSRVRAITGRPCFSSRVLSDKSGPQWSEVLATGRAYLLSCSRQSASLQA
jgi:hypothetical protein